MPDEPIAAGQKLAWEICQPKRKTSNPSRQTGRRFHIGLPIKDGLLSFHPQHVSRAQNPSTKLNTYLHLFISHSKKIATFGAFARIFVRWRR